jgi:hypothetical protein
MLSDLVTHALGLPEWAPRVFRRAAAALVVGMALFMPDTFRQGVMQYADQQTGRIMEQFVTPMLDGLEPATGSSNRNPGGAS